MNGTMNLTTLVVLALVFAAGFALGKFDTYLRRKRKHETLMDELEQFIPRDKEQRK